jgi:putative transposase
MTRIARVVVPGFAHHVTQRGNNQQDVFFVDDDRLFYLKLLGYYARRHGLEMNGYCLMTNHVHLIVTPRTGSSLAQTMGSVGVLYARYINQRHGRSGHLWQGRFFSCPIGDDHYLRVLRYVERNPVRAGICRQAWTYPFSSAAAHLGKADSSGLLNVAQWQRELAGLDWKSELSTGEDDAESDVIRRSSLNGRPLGSDAFISKLEHLAGCRLRPLPVGRPRKTKGKKR